MALSAIALPADLFLFHYIFHLDLKPLNPENPGLPTRSAYAGLPTERGCTQAGPAKLDDLGVFHVTTIWGYIGICKYIYIYIYIFMYIVIQGDIGVIQGYIGVYLGI